MLEFNLLKINYEAIIEKILDDDLFINFMANKISDIHIKIFEIE